MYKKSHQAEGSWMYGNQCQQKSSEKDARFHKVFSEPRLHFLFGQATTSTKCMSKRAHLHLQMLLDGFTPG